MAFYGRVSGTVLIDGSPVVRNLVAVSYAPFAVAGSDDGSGNPIYSRQVVAAGSSAADGTYTLDTIDNFTSEVIVIALDDYGDEWQPAKNYAVGDRLRPTSGNETGYVYECTLAGTSGVTEPSYWIDTGNGTGIIGTATFLAVPAWWPVAHAPIKPTIQGQADFSYPIEIDSDFPRVSLQLHGEGVNNGTNIIDSSSNNATPTITGTPTTTNLSRKVGATSLNLGTGNSLVYPSESFSPGLGDFTVEFWVQAITSTNDYGSVFQVTTSNGTKEHGIRTSNQGFGYFLHFSSDMSAFASIYHPDRTQAQLVGVWTHVVWQRENGSVTVYLDGNPQSLANSQSTNYAYSTYADPTDYSDCEVEIGGLLNMRYDELRVTYRAKYSGAFTPSEEPFADTRFEPGFEATILDPDFYKIVSRIHAEQGGGIAGDGFDDYLNTWNFVGNATVSAGESVFDSNSSVYFNGTNSAIYIENIYDNGDRALPVNGDSFTLEFWAYPTALGAINCLFSQYQSPQGASTDRLLFEIKYGILYAFHGNPSTGENGVTAMIANEWSHVAITFDNSDGAFRMYLNGVIEVDADWSALTGFLDVDAAFGARKSGSNYDHYFEGYLDEIRITHGVARYTGSTIDVPTAPYPDLDYDPLEEIYDSEIPPVFADEFIDEVPILARLNDASGSTDLFDEISGQNIGVTNNNNSQIYTSTTVSRFGTTSLALPNAGDYWYLDRADAIDFAEDLTVEFWVYISTLSDLRALIMQGAHSSDSDRFQFSVTTSGAINAFCNDNGTVLLSATDSAASVINTATWHHIAIVKETLDLRVYVDGVNVIDTQLSANWSNASKQTRVGYSRSSQTNRYLDGFISEFRVTKRARYTADFTAPTAQFPTAKYTPATEPFILDHYYDLSDTVLNLNDNFTNSGSGLSIWTATGTAFLTDSRFGSHSALIGASGSYIKSTDLPAFGTDEFCFECWVKGSSTTGARHLTDMRNGTSAGVYQWALYSPDGESSLVFWQDGIAKINGFRTIRDGEWHHVALARRNGYTTLYIDGYWQGAAVDTVNYATTARGFTIGAQTATSNYLYGFNGQIEDVRITIGSARYKGSFRPPVIEHGGAAISNRSIDDSTVLNWTDERLVNGEFIGYDEPGWTEITAPGSQRNYGFGGGTNNLDAKLEQRLAVPDNAIAVSFSGTAWNGYTQDHDSGIGALWFYDDNDDEIRQGGAFHSHNGQPANNSILVNTNVVNQICLVPAGARYGKVTARCNRATDGGNYNHGRCNAFGVRYLVATGDAVPTASVPVINGDFETGDLTGWTVLSGTGAEAAILGARTNYSYQSNQTAGSVIYQDIDIPAGNWHLINVRTLHRNDWNDRDYGTMRVFYYTANGTQIGQSDETTPIKGALGYAPFSIFERLPASTAKIRIQLKTVRVDQTVLNKSFDDVTAEVITDPDGVFATALGI